MDSVDERALGLLCRLTGVGDAGFRDGQLEAIRAVAVERRRAVVVQRTGWGKSAVYLIATRLLRDEGAGPTVIVSPLLALMRNQIEMTGRLGLRAETVNSSNPEEWEAIFATIRADELDLVLISPERLNNPQFLRDVRPHLFSRIGLLVIDEVHCISDWGHDFRPDYRRLQQIAAALPPGIPVLGTTATANDRVVADVREQLGDDLHILRGTLEREALVLQVLDIDGKAERMAWLAQNIPRLPGSGIVYCLTIHDAEAIGDWLASVGIATATYTGPTPNDQRLRIENDLSSGRLKVVVATSALAMGYDNPRIEFVVHYQTPGSPIAYYQQVGRAGRAVDTAYGVALSGWEDEEIQDWFISTAFPGEVDTSVVLRSLGAVGGMRIQEIEGVVNLRRSRLEAMLKILEVEGAVYREGSTWFRSATEWAYPHDRIAEVRAHRRAEQRAMKEYGTTDACLMQFLRSRLDDPGAAPCGRCANCAGPRFTGDLDPDVVDRAVGRVRGQHPVILPRLRLPCPLDVELDMREDRLEQGRSLTRWGDPGLADLVRQGKYEEGLFDRRLVTAVAAMIEEWSPSPPPDWVTWVPSSRGELVAAFVRELAGELGLPAIEAIRRARAAPAQRTMENSCQQARNVAGAFGVDGVRPGPVWLIDDIVDSRWTLTVVGGSLRRAGSGPVYPVALADASNRGQ